MRRTLEQLFAEMRGLVESRGGRLRARRLADHSSKVEFTCAGGHRCAVTPEQLRRGVWCRSCRGKQAGLAKRLATAERVRRIVADRGGRLAAAAYVDARTPIPFRCAEGHTWDATPARILGGAWCPRCARMRQHARKQEMGPVRERIPRIVEARGGRLLTKLPTSGVRVQVRCERGHVWGALIQLLDRGRWCPACADEARLEVMRAAAAKLGGECLSKRYLGARKRLRFRCPRGHEWEARPDSVRTGCWCARCRTGDRIEIGRMRTLARERGGSCLSATCPGGRAHLRWRCREGHEWEASPQSVLNGSWCPICNRGGPGISRRHLTLEDVRATAAERGGECLSLRFGGATTRMRWRCASGHEWIATVLSVRSGRWCRVCSNSTIGTLEGMRGLAIARGGRCLTRSWNDRRVHLRFVCSKGHRFSLAANVAKSGVWCPECRS